MTATAMAPEFGNIHPYSRLEENSKRLFVQFFEQIQRIIDHYVNHVNHDIMIKNNHVLNRNINTN